MHIHPSEVFFRTVPWKLDADWRCIIPLKLDSDWRCIDLVPGRDGIRGSSITFHWLPSHRSRCSSVERRFDTDSIAVSLVEIKQCYLRLSIRQDPKNYSYYNACLTLHCGVDDFSLHLLPLYAVNIINR